ncbi:hypothetical protein EYF80_003723 [Liparis tanakae]|uniref:Uncharacterized protein n=1 Tax=Liparis tanakae TaxID=230148 RepID=A0A4Z2J6R5_9TELE|nr:hypothetical protein EYF80_003723 [Liparis tanakae]
MGCSMVFFGPLYLMYGSVLLAPVTWSLLVGEYEALSVIQRGIFSLVAQEVPQLGGGEHTSVTRVVSEDRVQLGPPQQLPAELLDLDMIETIVTGSVAPLERQQSDTHTETHTAKFDQ